ncbi:hypothetical protein PanWU01x14_244940 [Parasponia andersonii]|uniref:Uncharacterized protein n=1 Tax=Parasponia andersonii TaxID=3476 RepID=A0A2P5BEU7_PARAD|nr:hypothetical protein PanWU01x14_244940 [Parasponia andersonii]
MTRLKYDRLEDCTSFVVRDDHQENDIDISPLGEIVLHRKLIKFRAFSNLQHKIIMSSIMYLQRVRDAYVKVMHRFAGNVVQLNNGNVYSFRKLNS